MFKGEGLNMNETVIIEFTREQLSEILQWADNVYTKSTITKTGVDLSDRLWKLFKEMKVKKD